MSSAKVESKKQNAVWKAISGLKWRVADVKTNITETDKHIWAAELSVFRRPGTCSNEFSFQCTIEKEPSCKLNPEHSFSNHLLVHFMCNRAN